MKLAAVVFIFLLCGHSFISARVSIRANPHNRKIVATLKNETNNTLASVLNFPIQWDCLQVYNQSSGLIFDCSQCQAGAVNVSNIEQLCNLSSNGVDLGQIIIKGIYPPYPYSQLSNGGVMGKPITLVVTTILGMKHLNCIDQNVTQVYVFSSGSLSLSDPMIYELTVATNIAKLTIVVGSLEITTGKVFTFYGTDVEIYADTVTGSGTIKTTPKPCIAAAPMLQPGQDGERGGNIIFSVLNPLSDIPTLDTTGGTGQQGGAGSAGTPENPPIFECCTTPEIGCCLSIPPFVTECTTNVFDMIYPLPPYTSAAECIFLRDNDGKIEPYQILLGGENGIFECPLGGASIPSASAGGPGPSGGINTFYNVNAIQNPGNAGLPGLPGIGVGVAFPTNVVSVQYSIFPDPLPIKIEITACPTDVHGPISPPSPPRPGNPSVGVYSLDTPVTLHTPHCLRITVNLLLLFQNGLSSDIITLIKQIQNLPYDDTPACQQLLSTIQQIQMSHLNNLDAWGIPIGMISTISTLESFGLSMTEFSVIVANMGNLLTFLQTGLTDLQIIQNSQDTISSLQNQDQVIIDNLILMQSAYNQNLFVIQNTQLDFDETNAKKSQEIEIDQAQAQKVAQNDEKEAKKKAREAMRKGAKTAIFVGIVKSVTKLAVAALATFFFVVPPTNNAGQLFINSGIASMQNDTLNAAQSATSNPNSDAGHKALADSLSNLAGAITKFLLAYNNIQVPPVDTGAILANIEENDPVLQQENAELARDTSIINSKTAENTQLQINYFAAYNELNTNLLTIGTLTNSIIRYSSVVDMDYVITGVLQMIQQLNQINALQAQMYNNYLMVTFTPLNDIDLSSSDVINKALYYIQSGTPFTQPVISDILSPITNQFTEMVNAMINQIGREGGLLQSQIYIIFDQNQIFTFNKERNIVVNVMDYVDLNAEQQQVTNVTFIVQYTNTTKVTSHITLEFPQETVIRKGTNLYRFDMQTQVVYKSTFQPYTGMTTMDQRAQVDLTGIGTLVPSIPESELALIMYTNPGLWGDLYFQIDKGEIVSFVVEMTYTYRPITDKSYIPLIVGTTGVLPTFEITCDMRRIGCTNTTIETFEEEVFFFPFGTLVTVIASLHDRDGRVFDSWSDGKTDPKTVMNVYFEQEPLIAYYA